MKISKWLIGILTAFSVIFFAGCGSNDDNNGSTNNSPVGAWHTRFEDKAYEVISVFDENGSGKVYYSFANGNYVLCNDFEWEIQNGEGELNVVGSIVTAKWDESVQQIVAGETIYFDNYFTVSVSGNSMALISKNEDKLILGKYTGSIPEISNQTETENSDNKRAISIIPIKDPDKSKSSYGIRFAAAIVSDKAEMFVIIPNNEKIAEVKFAVYDMIGNFLFESASVGEKFVWNLTNNAGRDVVDGTYLVIVEAKSIAGMSYHYSAKLGVSR